MFSIIVFCKVRIISYTGGPECPSNTLVRGQMQLWAKPSYELAEYIFMLYSTLKAEDTDSFIEMMKVILQDKPHKKRRTNGQYRETRKNAYLHYQLSFIHHCL